jgi:ankyrin repeat protein
MMCKSFTFILCCVVSLSGVLHAMTTPLHRAVKAGDVARVQELLLPQSNVDINAQDKYDRTALHWAACNGHTEIVQLLIAHQCDVNLTDEYGNTALHWATIKDKIEIVKLLITHRCDINAQDKYGNTVLYFAAMYGHTGIAQLLIAHQCNVNLTNSYGRTALHVASVNGKIEIVKLLIAYRCDINAQDTSDQTALQMAAFWRNFDVAQLLIAHKCDVNLTDIYNRTALMIAQERGYAEIVSLITHWQQFVDGLCTSLCKSLLAAAHPRCGQNSPISQMLSPYVRRDIVQCVLPPCHCTYSNNEIEYYAGLAEKNNTSVERKRKCSPDTTGQAKFQKRADR